LLIPSGIFVFEQLTLWVLMREDSMREMAAAARKPSATIEIQATYRRELDIEDLIEINW
jgi:hypothetical protein